MAFFVYEGFTDENGVFSFADRQVFVSNLHGGVVLAVVTAAVVRLGVLLFSRRDLN